MNHNRTRTHHFFSPSSTPKESLTSKTFFARDRGQEDLERRVDQVYEKLRDQNA